MMGDSAIDAQRVASERAASLCPECDAPPGSPHAPDCVLRPKLQYDDYLQQRYSVGDPEVYRIAGSFVAFTEYLDVV